MPTLVERIRTAFIEVGVEIKKVRGEIAARTTIAEDEDGVPYYAPGTTPGVVAISQAQADSRYAPATLLPTVPTWGLQSRPWNPTTGSFNCTPDTMRRWRKSLGAAAAGKQSAHVSAMIDSQTEGIGADQPRIRNSWPSQLRDRLARKYGDSGTGIMVPWAQYGINAAPAPNDRFLFLTSSTWPPPGVAGYPGVNDTGSMSFANGLGIYEQGALTVTSKNDSSNGGGLTRMAVRDIPAACTEIWVYQLDIAGIGPTICNVDNGSYIVLNHNSGTADGGLPWQEGYRYANGVGQVVHKIPVTPGSTHTIEIMGYPNIIVGVEGRTGKGVRVSNLGLSGHALSTLLAADEGAATKGKAGTAGLSLAVDAMRADLLVYMGPTNDWQGHTSVATTRARLTTLIDRQRAIGTHPDGGTQAGGDVLLVVPPQPDYTVIPQDRILTPALTDYFRMMYEVSVEKNVMLLDLAHRWKDYPSSSTPASLTQWSDAAHPNSAGYGDIAGAIEAVLTS